MNPLVLDLLVLVASVLLAASAIIALYRIVRGPSILDRMLATDVVLATIMCGLGGFMALSGRTDLLPVLIVLAMLGFVGSVSVSRYVSKSDSMTPGEEVGSLSDFSSSDWHMPKGSDGAVAKSGPDDEGEGPDDVARGISDISDGPDAVTVQNGADSDTADADNADNDEVDRDEKVHHEAVGDQILDDRGKPVNGSSDDGSSHDEDSGPTDSDPNGSDPDVEGEGLGTGPDSGPDDADDGARTGHDSDLTESNQGDPNRDEPNQDESNDGGVR